ncbi:MAG: hypothetical protein PVF83_07900 [Anaerolineales bacterium]
MAASAQYRQARLQLPDTSRANDVTLHDLGFNGRGARASALNPGGGVRSNI